MNLYCINLASLDGVITSTVSFHHSEDGQDFYKASMTIPRTSGVLDIVPLVFPEALRKEVEDHCGLGIRLEGLFRSYTHKRIDGSSHLELCIYVEYILSDDKASKADNQIRLEGFVCEPPVYRKTPRGRDITDLMIAVNDADGRSDYLPCIAWGRNAAFASRLNVGDKIWVQGRFQSRKYMKNLGEGCEEERTAYELSVSEIMYLGGSNRG